MVEEKFPLKELADKLWKLYNSFEYFVKNPFSRPYEADVYANEILEQVIEAKEFAKTLYSNSENPAVKEPYALLVNLEKDTQPSHSKSKVRGFF